VLRTRTLGPRLARSEEAQNPSRPWPNPSQRLAALTRVRYPQPARENDRAARETDPARERDRAARERDRPA